MGVQHLLLLAPVNEELRLPRPMKGRKNLHQQASEEWDALGLQKNSRGSWQPPLEKQSDAMRNHAHIDDPDELV